MALQVLNTESAQHVAERKVFRLRP
eukprot:SAG31_NODE_11340_length_1040_cov_1.783209_3_plen_24_part_01